MEKIQKPDFLKDNLEPILDITDQEILEIRSVLMNHISVEGLLGKVNKKLQTSYLTRKDSFSDVIFDTDNFIKIPKEKMNSEERILHAFFCIPNLKNDLNELLDYMNKMYEIIRFQNEETVDRIEDQVASMVIENALTNHYAAKIRILLPEADEDDDKPYEAPQRTEEEVKKDFEELSKHPLFLTDLPDNPEDNEMLRAMQALRFEGSSDDVASEFLENSKKNLDLYVKNKQFKYLKEAMLYICDAIDHLKEDKEISNEMKYKIYFFRAGIHIMVKNYGYAIDDLKLSIKAVDKDEAHLKIAECYIAMEDNIKAKRIIEERIKQGNISENSLTGHDEETTNKNTNKSDDESKLLSKFTEKLEKIKISEKEKQKKIQNLEVFKNMKEDEKSMLYTLLTDRGIKLKQQYHNIPPNYEAKIFSDEDKILHFPVLIVYEEFNTTDYLRDVEEGSLISDIIETLFEESLPADKDKKYNLNTVKCFLEMSEMDTILKKETNVYFPLRSDDRLIDILTHEKVYMNGLPVIFIVSQITKFYTHFMNNKIILKRSADKNKYNNKM